jgi:LDH2 family malate/lactate/ureidoglycolate dehydrogenase
MTEAPKVIRVPQEVLRDYVARAGARGGVPGPQLALFVDSFVEADLRGVGTHGVTRIPAYVRAFLQGIVNPSPVLRTIRQTPASALVDADNGLGMVTGQMAIDQAIEIARRVGVGTVAVRNSNHSGMLAVHVLRAAREGMIGFFTSNGAAIMAPWGGADPRLSNGPFAWALPRGGGESPIVVDMAASASARGKIRQIAETGGAIPAGWALDADGRATTDARAAMGGVVLPMAGHKGYAVGFVNEALSAVLSGAALAVDTPRGFLADGSTVLDSWRTGHLAIVLDPDVFVGRSEFLAGLERLIGSVRETRPAEGFDGVLMPGEPEWANRERNVREGIPLPARTVSALNAFADEIGVQGLGDRWE